MGKCGYCDDEIFEWEFNIFLTDMWNRVLRLPDGRPYHMRCMLNGLDCIPSWAIDAGCD